MKRSDVTAGDVAKMTTEERAEWEEKAILATLKTNAGRMYAITGQVSSEPAKADKQEATLALEGALWRIRRGGRLVATYGTRLEAQRALKALDKTKLDAPIGSDKESRSEAERYRGVSD